MYSRLLIMKYWMCGSARIVWWQMHKGSVHWQQLEMKVSPTWVSKGRSWRGRQRRMVCVCVTVLKKWMMIINLGSNSLWKEHQLLQKPLQPYLKLLKFKELTKYSLCYYQTEALCYREKWILQANIKYLSIHLLCRPLDRLPGCHIYHIKYYLCWFKMSL